MQDEVIHPGERPYTHYAAASTPYITLHYHLLHLPPLIPFRFSEMVGYPPESSLMTLPPAPILNELNQVPLTCKHLTQVLSDLSERLYRSFKRQMRFVVHGGAVMVLHPSLSHRESTKTSTTSIAHSYPSIARSGFPMPGNNSARALRRRLTSSASARIG
jgi:hypothetical protein